MGEEMNWFEDDTGIWINLDLVNDIVPPGMAEEKGILTFTNGETWPIELADWVRLKAQLLNGQRPADRRPERPEPAPESDTRTSKPNPAADPNSNPKDSADE